MAAFGRSRSYVADNIASSSGSQSAHGILGVRAPRIILNRGRQVGKSTVITALALHTCLYKLAVW